MTRTRFRFFDAALLMAVLQGVTALNADAQADPSNPQLIGAPVIAADGIKIGQVSDVSTTPDGQIDQIRVLTGSALGFGERVVAIPQPAFMIRGRRVTLPDLTSGDVEAFPTARAATAGHGQSALATGSCAAQG